MSYQLSEWDRYDYTQLNKIKAIKRTTKQGTELYNNAVMMLDTETSKKDPDTIGQNHIVAFTLSIRYQHENICTLYGHKPTELINAWTWL